MDLLDRYLGAVAFWLPSREGRDVTAELRDDIRSEIEAREDALGRPLHPADVEEILTRWGHPMRVAERYLPARALIGPALLPVYLLVLKIFAAVFGGWLAVLGIAAVSLPRWDPSGDRLYDTLDGLFLAALCVFAVTTVLFAVAERSTARARRIETWTAAQLSGGQTRRDRRRISRSEAGFEFAVGVMFLGWWTGIGTPFAHWIGPQWVIDDRVAVTWAPVVPAFYWAITAVAAASVAMSLVNVARPRWTIQRLGLQMAIDSFALVFVLLMLPLPVFTVTPIDASPEKVAAIATWINTSWTIGLVIAAICLTFALFESYRRLAGPPRGTSARLT